MKPKQTNQKEKRAQVSCLFDEIKAAGIPFSNHESDLYVPNTPAVLAILAKYPNKRPERFINQAPPNVGEVWLDIPFAYQPFWDAVQKRAEARKAVAA